MMKQGRIRWVGVFNVYGKIDISGQKVFNEAQEERRKQGRPRKRWLDDLKCDLRSLRARGWLRFAEERDE